MAACGDDFTVAVTEDGELFACGQGDHGQLGLGAVLHQQQPARAGGPERQGHACLPTVTTTCPPRRCSCTQHLAGQHDL